MSSIIVKCNSCGKLHKFGASDFPFDQVDSNVRQMGNEIMYQGQLDFECSCGNSISITHEFWEYPVDVENDKQTNVTGGEIEQNSL